MDYLKRWEGIIFKALTGLDNTRFIVNWNNGNPIMRNYNPLSYLGSKVYNIYDSDDTVKDRIYRKQKDNTVRIVILNNNYITMHYSKFVAKASVLNIYFGDNF